MVTMLTARFRGTARQGASPSGQTRTGRRNSAPPSPIDPPSTAIGTEQANASLGLAMSEWDSVVTASPSRPH